MPLIFDFKTLKHSSNAFDRNNSRRSGFYNDGPVYSYKPDRYRHYPTVERSIVNSIYNRIATDVASLTYQHVRVDENGKYSELIKSGLNDCLNTAPNLDQTPQAFMIDLVESLFDEGVVAIVPVETTLNPELTGSYDINSIRIGKILDWSPKRIFVHLYDERDSQFHDIWVDKQYTAIVENPFYSVMNSPNSTLQRLIRKLALLDSVDEQSSSGKLDLIIQLPYAIKSESRKALAEERKTNLEAQLTNSKYGIGYIDATEKIVQLNRSVDNNLLNQIEYLTKMVYNQLNMSEGVFDGTADEKTMLNYFNNTITPIARAIVLEMRRKYITKTARTQGQDIIFYRDPFRLVPVSQIAEIADKFTRNEILSPNEVRSIIGYKPANDPAADELRNRNLNQNESQIEAGQEAVDGMMGEDGGGTTLLDDLISGQEGMV